MSHLIGMSANVADLPLRARSLIVVSVVIAHVLLLWFLAAMPELPGSRRHEMSVSVALPSPPKTAPAEPEPIQKPAPKPALKREPEPVAAPVETRRAEPAPEIVMPAAVAEAPAPKEVHGAPQKPVEAPPAPPDREPDYRAAYLDNPAPVYPMVARRMGWQGRVVLSVEVLSDGLPGQIKLHQSSGYDALDNAAMGAVRNWRFVAARQGGQNVTRWFLVPIPFILKEG